MPNVKVIRSIDIKAPLTQVSASINDFKNWHKWSPWIVLEPTSTLTYPEKASYCWEGEIIGAGEMHLIDEVFETGHEEREEYLYDLRIKKPHKTKARVKLILETVGLYTRVHWELNSQLPPYLFLIKNKISTQIGMDYERGLNMLKDLSEHGELHSAVSEIGARNITESEYLTLSDTSTIKGLKSSLTESFKIATQLYKNAKVWTKEEPVVFYDKFDIERGLCVYRVGIPVTFTPNKEDYPSEFQYVKVKGYNAFTIAHKGAYHHLPNAWALGMTLAEQKAFTLDKDTPVMEVYKNAPQKTENEADHLTHVLLPIKE